MSFDASGWPSFCEYQPGTRIPFSSGPSDEVDSNDAGDGDRDHTWSVILRQMIV